MLRQGMIMGLALSMAATGIAVAEPQNDGEAAQLQAVVRSMLQANQAFVGSHDKGYFAPFRNGQHPRATVVTCSDSRVHTQALVPNPDNELFMIRNIGNQLSTSEGSVEYGVHHLHTPLLMFVGHSACGAIKAALGDYSKESAAIKRELNDIHIAKNGDWMGGVKTNVNDQVGAAMKKFAHEVESGELTVVGAVYDFRNDLGQGYGKLAVININGETDPARIAQSRIFAGGKADSAR